MIIIESKRKKPAAILKKYPDAILADVTSSAKDDLVKLNPFYPHGGILVPSARAIRQFMRRLYVKDWRCLKGQMWTRNTITRLVEVTLLEIVHLDRKNRIFVVKKWQYTN